MNTINPSISPELKNVIDDLQSHYHSWRSALEIARDNSIAIPDAPEVDDKAYWEHEIRVLDRVFTQAINIKL